MMSNVSITPCYLRDPAVYMPSRQYFPGYYLRVSQHQHLRRRDSLSFQSFTGHMSPGRKSLHKSSSEVEKRGKASSTSSLRWKELPSQCKVYSKKYPTTTYHKTWQTQRRHEQLSSVWCEVPFSTHDGCLYRLVFTAETSQLNGGPLAWDRKLLSFSNVLSAGRWPE